MQGKELSEQATAAQSSLGIDVGKTWLDVHVLPEDQRLRVANDGQGIRRLKRWLTGFSIRTIVVEATGKWHRQLCRSLAGSGLAVAIIDPFKVRAFAKAHGILAKTDRLDARVLALFAQLLDPPAHPPAPELLDELAELIQARNGATAERTALANQRSSATLGVLKRQLARRIGMLDRHIAALDAEVMARIKADAALARRYAILISIPAVGPATAMTLIANLRELGALGAKQITMLAGLAPIADDSGERHGVRTVWAGRGKVRRALYLAALSAARFNPHLAAVYRRLAARGKPAKVALIAIARKLVILANSLIAQNRQWQPNAPQSA
jgi:transposase